MNHQMMSMYQYQASSGEKKHANRHIHRFLKLSPPPRDLQIVTNGKVLTAAALSEERYNPSVPIWVTDTPGSIGMVVPQNLTMRKLGNIIGMGYPVSVIDVEHQEELEGWTLGDLVEYFEDEERLLILRQTSQAAENPPGRRKRRCATAIPPSTNVPKILNQISLEFRHTPLAAQVKSPQFVRDLDWIDHAWTAKAERPQTQYYCLTSTGGCYTDFHVDFGGTSVWYHVLTGAKHFILIPPTPKNLQAYEDWLCQPSQAEIFLPDMLEDGAGVQKVILKEGQTLFIPCGWIHAVYTPIDSLVIGGNFLHGLDISRQIDVHSLEMRTKVPSKFRFPKYLALAMYAGVWYVKKVRQGRVSKREVEGLPTFLDALRQWSQVPSDPDMVQAMIDIGDLEGMLKDLQEELDRIKEHGICPNPKYKVTMSNNAAATTPNESAEPKPKLRLKLSESTASASPPTFRIKLSSGSQFSSVPSLGTNKRKAREDLDYIGGRNDDDEWKPSARLSAAVPRHPVPPKSSLVTTKRSLETKKPVTSRQRLMKRFR